MKVQPAQQRKKVLRCSNSRTEEEVDVVINNPVEVVVAGVAVAGVVVKVREVMILRRFACSTMGSGQAQAVPMSTAMIGSVDMSIIAAAALRKLV